jgi:NADPH-dependent glutamate synthase beta subunit-like oxidoreductase
LIPEYRKEVHSLRGALYSGQTAKTRREQKSDLPPCQEACPVNLQTRRYTRLVAEGKYLEALDVIREELPFPGVIGRICHHPCEEACLRGEKIDDAVSLCVLKRFVADYEVGKREIPVPIVGDQKGRKVAVIGGGPSGMACALDLRKAGYAVTLFEGHDRLGGMLYFCVPAYRLPKQVLEREVSLVEKAGVEVRNNSMVGKEISLKKIYETFDALYIACGAQRGAKLRVENEDAAAVIGGVEFLEMANQRQPVEIGERVIVVGGGNVAVDTARTASRLGAKDVRIVCLEKREGMPAGAWEIEQAREEGAKILARWAPKRILVDAGRVKGIELMRCTSVFDDNGRFNPSYNERITKTLDADMIIVAIGQAPEVRFLKDLDGLETTDGGWVKTDPKTLETSIPGIFAGGDVVAGPGMAIDAIADGKKAAVSIDRYLSEARENKDVEAEAR